MNVNIEEKKKKDERADQIAWRNDDNTLGILKWI